MARVRDEVMPAYVEIGPEGAFALALMRKALDDAARAMAEGDVIAMIAAHEDLKGFHVSRASLSGGTGRMSESLAAQVNRRRLERGREPLRLAHIERAIRFVAGPRPPAGRPECFNAKQRVLDRPPELRAASVVARRAYIRAARGRAA